MVSSKKHTVLQSITAFVDNYPNFSLINFDKTKHSKLEELRKILKKESSQIKVIKNSLFEKAINRLALSNNKFKEFRKKVLPLKEQTAILGFPSDWSKGLNIFYQFLKKEKTLTFKAGYLEEEIFLADALEKIALLPGKDRLLSQIIGSLKSPMSKLVYSLNYNMTKLVYILHTQSKKEVKK